MKNNTTIEMKINIRNRKDIDESKIIELYREGKTGPEIATILGVHWCTIYRRLRFHGISIGRGGWKKGRRPVTFKGGYIESRSGYRIVWIPFDDPMSVMGVQLTGTQHGVYVREHRLVMARSLNRPLERWEIVHHKNHDRLDNRLENLELISRAIEHHGETFAHQEFLALKARVEKLEIQVSMLLAVLVCTSRQADEKEVA